MRVQLQLVLDAIVDSFACVSFHFVTLEGPAVGCEDQGEDSEECDNFHDIQI